MASLDMFKSYGELGDECNEVVANLCLNAAGKAMQNAGVPDGLDGDADYDLCQCMLALHYYDNRGVISPTDQKEIPLGVQSFVNQLKNTTPTAEGGDAG